MTTQNSVNNTFPSGVSATTATISNTTNQIVLGTTNTLTISSVAPATSQTLNITDAAANSNMVQCNTTNTTILIGPPYKATTTLTIAGNGSGASVSGSGNTIYGQGTGATLTTGTNCTLIGGGNDVSSSSAIERMAIGQGITVNNNHQCVIGSALLSVVPGNVGTTTLGQNASPWAAIILGLTSSNNINITPATQAAARAITVPDALGASNIVLSSQSAQSQSSTISTGVSITGPSGTITTVSVSTAASTTAGTFVVTNTFYTAATQVITVHVAYGSATTGTPYAYVSATTPGSNTFSVTIRNIDTSAALNGTLKVYFNIM